MGDFLDAARKALESANKPLKPSELTEVALDHGFLETRGKTPSQTMKSKLSTDILKRREKSVFMRTGENTFALRCWSSKYPEYTADRFEKALLDEEVVVFPRSRLREFVPVDGLWKAPILSQDLLGICHNVQRREAEERFDIVQLVSVFIVKYNDRYLTYKRSRRLPEKRLHHTYSIAFGGHLNPDDVSRLLDIFVPDLGLPLIERELSEELRLPHVPDFRYKGLLYDSSREVSSQHLGIVYDVVLSEADFEIGERGFLIDARLETAADISDRISDFENWSVILLNDEMTEEVQESVQG